MDGAPGYAQSATICGVGRLFGRTLPRRQVLPMKRRVLAILGYVALFTTTLPAIDNGLARTPPMGWNSWNKFACDVSEDAVRGVAAAMVKNGMRDAGYQYIVIDDCWQISRDAEGNKIGRAHVNSSHR